jgi:antitoxin component YwqK of YwqJK toxin-antitoxin module
MDTRYLIIAKTNQNTTTTDGENLINLRLCEGMFWANGLDVLKIIDLDNRDDQSIHRLESFDHSLTNYSRKKMAKLTFTIGNTESRESESEEESECLEKNKVKFNCCCFKTIEQAFFSGRSIPHSYTGTWISYDTNNGSLEKIENYVNGTLHGRSLNFYDNKVSRENQYKDGKLDGASIRYYPDGKLASFSQYKDGKRIGTGLTFLPDQRLMSLRNNECGIWFYR